MTASLLWKLNRLFIMGLNYGTTYVQVSATHQYNTRAHTHVAKLSPATFSNFVLLFSTVTFKSQKITQTHVILIVLRIHFKREPGKLSRYSDTLRAGRSGDRNPLVAILSRPALGTTHNEYRVFPGGKAAGTWRSPPTELAPTLKKEYSYTSTPPPSGPSWPVLG